MGDRCEVVDLEIELTTILCDTFCNIGEKPLQEKSLANESVKEQDGFFDNHYSGRSKDNIWVVSHPCGNTLMEETFLYAGIENVYICLVDEALSIVMVWRGTENLARLQTKPVKLALGQWL